ncbi:hypothetical protein SPH9361_03240 [Sphingobium sp. CECT 9361]|nr:hypothetical protein SPH9361_03240 [Sphingobium sp. CECT 9361]
MIGYCRKGFVMRILLKYPAIDALRERSRMVEV